MKKLIWSSFFIVALMVGSVSYATETSITSSDTQSVSDVTTVETTEATETTNDSQSEGMLIAKSDVSLLITDMVNQGKLSQFQYEDLMRRLEKATKPEEVSLVYSDALDLAKLNKQLYQSSFDEKVYNTKYQLELLVKSGRMTQNQADEFIAKIDNSKTIEELDNIWAEIETMINQPTSTTTDSTEETSATTSSKTKEHTNQVTTSSDKKSSSLPKTGEQQLGVGLPLITVGSILLVMVLIKRKS